MKKRIIISILIAFLIVGGFLGYLLLNNRVVSTITLDINPSIELGLTKNEIVRSIVALNDDAKRIVNSDLNGKSLNEILKVITNNLIENGYANENQIMILLHSQGTIDSKKIESELKSDFNEKNVRTEIITISNTTKEDEELKEKYNITLAKAAYINLIKKENDNIVFEDLVNKSLNEIKETKESGKFCHNGYTLEGDFCIKEIDRVQALSGEVCPEGYYEYDSNCYEETKSIEGIKDACREDFILKNNECVLTITEAALGECSNGEYDSHNDTCVERNYVGDAYEFCRDPGRTLYEHKCLATKPTINGKCLGSDALVKGKCVNLYSDYYAAEWKCKNGDVISNPDGTLQNADKKCYEEKKVKASSYKCPEGYTLFGKNCVRTETEPLEKEKICPSGYVMLENGRCINYNKKTNKKMGYYCALENAKLINNSCIIYEVIDASK